MSRKRPAVTPPSKYCLDGWCMRPAVLPTKYCASHASRGTVATPKPYSASSSSSSRTVRLTVPIPRPYRPIGSTNKCLKCKQLMWCSSILPLMLYYCDYCIRADNKKAADEQKEAKKAKAEEEDESTEREEQLEATEEGESAVEVELAVEGGTDGEVPEEGESAVEGGADGEVPEEEKAADIDVQLESAAEAGEVAEADPDLTISAEGQEHEETVEHSAKRQKLENGGEVACANEDGIPAPEQDVYWFNSDVVNWWSKQLLITTPWPSSPPSRLEMPRFRVEYVYSLLGETASRLLPSEQAQKLCTAAFVDDHHQLRLREELVWLARWGLQWCKTAWRSVGTSHGWPRGNAIATAQEASIAKYNAWQSEYQIPSGIGMKSWLVVAGQEAAVKARPASALNHIEALCQLAMVAPHSTMSAVSRMRESYFDPERLASWHTEFFKALMPIGTVKHCPQKLQLFTLKSYETIVGLSTLTPRTLACWTMAEKLTTSALSGQMSKHMLGRGNKLIKTEFMPSLPCGCTTCRLELQHLFVSWLLTWLLPGAVLFTPARWSHNTDGGPVKGRYTGQETPFVKQDELPPPIHWAPVTLQKIEVKGGNTLYLTTSYVISQSETKPVQWVVNEHGISTGGMTTAADNTFINEHPINLSFKRSNPTSTFLYATLVPASFGPAYTAYQLREYLHECVQQATLPLIDAVIPIICEYFLC